MRSGHWLTARRNRPSAWQTRSMPEWSLFRQNTMRLPPLPTWRLSGFSQPSDGEGTQAAQIFHARRRRPAPSPRAAPSGRCSAAVARRASRCRAASTSGVSPSANPARTIGSLDPGPRRSARSSRRCRRRRRSRCSVTEYRPGFWKTCVRDWLVAGRAVAEIPARPVAAVSLRNLTVSGGTPSVTDAVIFASGRSFSPGRYGVKR